MAEFTVNGIELGGLRTGDGPPLLALHGAGGPASLAPMTAALSKHFEVLVPHHPGFADSETVPAFDSVDDLAYLYLDLLEAYDLRDVTLMGFSMGGWTAAEAAVKSTERIARLILVDAVGIRVEGAEIADIFSVPPSEMPKLAFHDPSLAPDPASLTVEDKVAMARAREAAVRYTWEPYMHNPKLKARLARVHVPALVIWGESDRIVSVPYGEAYAAALPDARLVVIEEAGHQPQVEQTERFVSEVLDFAGMGTLEGVGA